MKLAQAREPEIRRQAQEEADKRTVQLKAERDEMVEKVGQAEVREKAIREEARSQAAQQISKIGAERELEKLTSDILELDVQEKKSHDNVWRKRGSLATRVTSVLREIDTEVAAVVEGQDNKEFSVAS